MSYGRYPYGGVGYAGADVAEIPEDDTETHLAVEVSFTTGALETPVWVDVAHDVRSWDTSRGRRRELERFQPGRATVFLSNLERQYDSVHAAGPWFGNLRPMRRMRIRETFNGTTFPVFDGYIDKWVLDYPGTGHDATATIIATDAFKIFQRTDLPRSVYAMEVAEDAPSLWWHLDEGLKEGAEERVALNAGSIGDAGNGTYVGAVDPGARAMVVHDPGTSLELTNDLITPGTPLSGVDIPVAQFNALARMNAGLPFVVEGWCRPINSSGGQALFFQQATSPRQSLIILSWYNSDSTGRFYFAINDAVAGTHSMTTPANSAPPGSIYHVVLKAVPSGADMFVSVYVNGALAASDTFVAALAEASVSHSALGHSADDNFNWNGRLQEFAVYLPASGDPLPDVRISAHYAAGTHPWQDDTCAERLGRVLNIVEWSSTLREFDTGSQTLQSAETREAPALEHLEKVAATEFGLFFMAADGRARFIDRATLFARTPLPAIYGDAADGTEIGYRDFVPDDGDDVIRNEALISRLNGTVKEATDTASIEEFGRFDYVLEGLLHRTEAHSQTYANFIVAEYHDPRRRITTLTLGPASADEAATLYPAMLGPELGDTIVVRSRPIGGGAMFQQTCAVEGVDHSGDPGGMRTTTLRLSPEFAGSF